MKATEPQSTETAQALPFSGEEIPLSQIVAATNAAIYARSEGEHPAYLFVSEGAVRLFGYRRELLLRPGALEELIHEDDRAAATLAFSTSPDFGTAEYRILHADGTFRWLRDQWQRSESGTKTFFAGTLVDVSSLRETSALLERETRQHMRAKRDLEQFAHVASHDLRAPLLAIGTLAEWLETDLGPTVGEEGHEQMRLLRGRVQRMDRLLSDLLEYAKVGRVKISPETVDVKELIEEVLDLADLETSVTLVTPKELPSLFTARLPLKRVFLGLLGNCARHHDALPARVTIETRSIGEYDEFTIADDGPGIPPEFYDRVFEMFQTLKPRDANEGSGMGLTLVRRLIEWSGGRIALSPNTPRGVVVTFSWPKVWKAIPTASGSIPRMAIAKALKDEKSTREEKGS